MKMLLIIKYTNKKETCNEIKLIYKTFLMKECIWGKIWINFN